MNILVIGSGGREHAMAWKIRQSPRCGQLFIAPGNAGTSEIGTNVPLQVDDFEGLKSLVAEKEISLVVVGPEAPLVKGIVDYFQKDETLRSTPIIGPDQIGAQLEGSKDFSKAFMTKHGVPTGKAETFTKDSLEAGIAYLESQQPPYVLKADGLAAGKGVVILDSLEEAKAELTDMLVGSKFGHASAKVLIEEFLEGIELSVFVLTDGKNYKILPEAKDYKRIGEGDTGLNTGGMGAVSPVAFAQEGFLEKVEQLVVQPTLEGLNKEGIDYKGFIFIGLMNANGHPYVIEYNVRMGDPESEVVFPRMKTDLVELLLAVWENRLDEVKLEISDETAVTVMLVSEGYPGSYPKGKVIEGLAGIEEQIVFHAGTTLQSGQVLTNGGRVISVTGLGHDLNAAKKKAYEGTELIHWEGKNLRKDIGHDLQTQYS